MGEFDKYHLRAQYSFDVEGTSLATMSAVEGQLKEIASAVRGLESAVSRSGGTISKLGKAFGSSASSMSGAQNQILSTGKSAIKTEGYLKDLKDEFKAISEEAKGVRFGSLADPRGVDRGTKRLAEYSDELKKVKSRIAGTSAQERVLSAQIERQSSAIKDRIELMKRQREALRAAEDKGFYDAMKSASQEIVERAASVGAEFVNIYADFDDKMAAVGAVSRASAEDMDLLRKKSKELGASTRYTSGQAAEAQRMLAAAGFRAKDILVGVGDALSLASAGQLELGTSADIASNVLSGLNLRVEQLGHVTDVMALAAASANTNISQLGVAMSYAAPPAQLFGAEIEQVSAMIGVMSDSGIQADKAGTALRSTFLRLANPPSQAAAALEEYNIAVADASTGKLRNIVDVLEELSVKLKLDPDSMAQFSMFMSDVEEKGGDMDEAMANLPEGLHNQANAIKALNAIFGKTAISGASAAIAGLDKIKWMSLSGAASSVEFEKALSEGLIPATAEFQAAMDNAKINKTNFFEELIKIVPDFKTANKAVLDAVMEITRTDFRMKLDRRNIDELSEYFQNIEEFKDADLSNLKNGGELFDRLVKSTDDADAALALMRTGMQKFGIVLPHQTGAAQKMAETMEDNLAGSFRALGSAVEAVKLSVIEPLAPLIRGIADALTAISLTIANLPGPIRALISYLGALTVAMSGVLTVFFTGRWLLAGFAEAQASVAIASRTMQKSLLPLHSLDTFFDEFAGTNPADTMLFNRITEFVKAAWRQNVIPFVQGLTVAMRGLSASFMGFAATPLGATLIALTAIYFIIEAATPRVSLLGKTLGATFGWVAGIVGFVYGFLSNTVQTFFKELEQWFRSGEKAGEDFARFVLTPFRVAAGMVVQAWRVLMAIVGGFFFVLVQRAQWVQGNLVQLLNHDTTGTIAIAWMNLKEQIFSVLNTVVGWAVGAGDKIAGAWVGAAQSLGDLGFMEGLAPAGMGGVASTIGSAWETAIGFIFTSWTWLVSKASWVQGMLVQLLNHDTTETIANAWSSLKEWIFGILGEVARWATEIGGQIIGAIASPFVSAFEEVSSWAAKVFSPIISGIDSIANAVRNIKAAIAPLKAEFVTIANAFGMALPTLVAPPQLSESQQRQAQLYNTLGSGERASISAGGEVERGGITVNSKAIAEIEAIRQQQAQYDRESRQLVADNRVRVREAKLEILGQVEDVFQFFGHIASSLYGFHRDVFFNVGKNLDLFSFTTLSLSSLFLGLDKVVLDSTKEMAEALGPEIDDETDSRAGGNRSRIWCVQLD